MQEGYAKRVAYSPFIRYTTLEALVMAHPLLVAGVQLADARFKPADILSTLCVNTRKYVYIIGRGGSRCLRNRSGAKRAAMANPLWSI